MSVLKKRSKLPYRTCVGVMVLNPEGQVWVGRRISGNQEGEAAGKLWQMPQGGVDKGESLEIAARRELLEESGIRSVELLMEGPEWIYYDLPADVLGIALKGKYCGQKQRWFAYRFTGRESEINIDQPVPGVDPEFDRWKWIDMETLPSLIVPFKREAYEEVVKTFKHLVV